MSDLGSSLEETYGYMSKPNTDWNESIKIQWTTILKNLFIEIETRSKKCAKMLFL